VSAHMPSGVPVLRFLQNGSQAYEVDMNKVQTL